MSWNRALSHPSWTLSLFALAVLAFGLVAISCGDDDDNGDDDIVAGTPTAADSETPTVSDEETPSDGETPAETPTESEGSDAGEAIQVTAQDLQFDTDTITVTAGEPVVIEFTNMDAVPHNIAVYETEEAENEIFVGDLVTGPDESITYEFDAPDEPGTYYFHCDVHPDMNGDFIVE